MHDRIDRVFAKDWRTAEEVFDAIGWRADTETDEIDEETNAD